MFHVEHVNLSHHDVSRETFSRVDKLIDSHRSSLENYLEQLLWWNKRVNLVSRDVSRGTVWEHIRHSLLLTQFEVYREADFVLDAGTGGGLPGIPLAIASPEKKFLLNDIVAKKVISVRQMVQKLGLNNTECEDRSIKDIDIDTPFLLISKHAFKINELWRMANEKPWKSMVFYKGLDFEGELEGIENSLIIDSHNLSAGTEFYRGKTLVFIARG